MLGRRIKRTNTVQTILHLLGSLILIQGFLLLLPLAIVALYHEYAIVWAFLVPCLLSSLVGFFLIKFSKPGTVRYLQAMLICGMAWLIFSCVFKEALGSFIIPRGDTQLHVNDRVCLCGSRSDIKKAVKFLG